MSVSTPRPQHRRVQPFTWFTFLCVACSDLFEETSPKQFCPRCDRRYSEEYGEMSGS